MKSLDLKKTSKYFVPFIALFIAGCGVGTGMQTTSTVSDDEVDFFSTIPKDFDSPFSVTFSSGFIETEEDVYEVQEFNMTLQENPVDPNSVKLTIDVKTPETKPQKVSIYTTKNEYRDNRK